MSFHVSITILPLLPAWTTALCAPPPQPSLLLDGIYENTEDSLHHIISLLRKHQGVLISQRRKFSLFNRQI